MRIPLSKIKILKTKFVELILNREWCSLLLKGNFYEFEKLLHEKLLEVYDKICETLIGFVSQSSEFEIAQKEGLKKLAYRTASFQLRTGTKISHQSLYAKESPTGYKRTRLSSLKLNDTNFDIIWHTCEV